ncbi:Uncharacterised protein [uncultured archaeon]|nr:Uncharacterised protein [uncultured archaeon]
MSLNSKSRDISKLANIFGASMGTVSIPKLFSSHFEADFSGSGKREQITYLLNKYKEDPKELLYIVQEIINNHTSVTAKNITPINDSLISLNLKVDPETYKAEIIRVPIHDVEMVLNNIAAENPMRFEDILPSEIIQKAKTMAQAYMIIYCSENTLRLFIDKISIEKFGDNYWNSLNIPRELKDKVGIRKKEETKNLFHALRGEKELFYLDMDDLGRVIEQNWDIFKTYFPNLSFIRQRITELTITRNLVAHNSKISDEDYLRILLYYKDILRQIGSL